jgi:hypothetical protein
MFEKYLRKEVDKKTEKCKITVFGQNHHEFSKNKVLLRVENAEETVETNQ